MPKPNHRPIVSYRDLDAWQLAMDIVIDVYRLTRALPAEERFGLSAQLRRAAVAIPSNIAEGHSRIGGGEFRRFVSIARGSGAEVETQIAVAVALGLIVGDEITSLSSKLDRLSRMLFSLYRSLQT
jgi:four helix bundle protein